LQSELCALSAFFPLLLLIAACPALAQQAEPRPAAPEPAGRAEKSSATRGRRRSSSPGSACPSVLGEYYDPEFTLDRREIPALGRHNVAEAPPAPRAANPRGRGRGGAAKGPWCLSTGRRISGFAEIRNLPPESILRTEVLPRKWRCQYGFRADQRVVNFVLRPRFRAITAK
jgi:hypothetical protein